MHICPTLPAPACMLAMHLYLRVAGNQRWLPGLVRVALL